MHRDVDGLGCARAHLHSCWKASTASAPPEFSEFSVTDFCEVAQKRLVIVVASEAKASIEKAPHLAWTCPQRCPVHMHIYTQEGLEHIWHSW